MACKPRQNKPLLLPESFPPYIYFFPGGCWTAAGAEMCASVSLNKTFAKFPNGNSIIETARLPHFSEVFVKQPPFLLVSPSEAGWRGALESRAGPRRF